MSTHIPHPSSEPAPSKSTSKKKKAAQSILTLHCFDPKKTSALSVAIAQLDPRVRSPEEIQLGVHPATLFFPQPSHNSPPWLKIIGPYTEYARDLKNLSHSAIILLEVDGYIFAATFGRSQHLLPRDLMLRNFGLRTVINAVSPDDLRSIDMKSFESLAMHKRVQASSQSTIHRFGIDWTRDLLRAVTGTPMDPNFAKRVSGADALVICGHHTLEDAPAICRQAMSFYDSDNYKRTPWSYIDFLQPEYDSGIIEHLEKELAAAIMHPDEGNQPLLALDEIVDYTGIVSYSIQPSRRHRTSTLDLKALQVFILQHDSRTPLEWLKTAWIQIHFADAPTTSNRHRVYNSLDWSTRYKNRMYIFTSGIWLRVDKEYAQRLNACISGLAKPTADLPLAPPNIMTPDKTKKNDEKGEGLYIASVTSDPYTRLKIHPNSFKSELMNEEVEPCDVLGANGSLYYIKRKGEASGLSHLFTQGLTAALTLYNDAGYRRQFREVIDAAVNEYTMNEEEKALVSQAYREIFPEDGIHPSALEVCFVVIRNSDRNWPDSMPYLSKVSLYEAYRRLREAKFDVRLQCVTPVRAAAEVRKGSSNGPLPNAP